MNEHTQEHRDHGFAIGLLTGEVERFAVAAKSDHRTEAKKHSGPNGAGSAPDSR